MTHLTEVQQLRRLLSECIERIRGEAGDQDPFAFDADWEAWALDVDAALAGRPLPDRPRFLGRPRVYRVACVFDPHAARFRGKDKLRGPLFRGMRPGQQPARCIRGIWRAADCEECAHGDQPGLVPPVRVQRSGNTMVLFISSLRAFKRNSIINPAKQALQYVRMFGRPAERVAFPTSRAQAEAAALSFISEAPPASAYQGDHSVNVAELLKAIKK